MGLVSALGIIIGNIEGYTNAPILGYRYSLTQILYIIHLPYVTEHLQRRRILVTRL